MGHAIATRTCDKNIEKHHAEANEASRLTSSLLIDQRR